MLTIRRAVFPEDAETVAELILGYVAFLFERMPQDRDNIVQKYDPAQIDSLVAGFAERHARPRGELLIALLEGVPVGCGMMSEMEPDIAEIQRVFVRPEARGHGAGKALIQALMDRARTDGKSIVRLDTGRELVEAIALYRALGFRERPPYHAATPYLDHTLVFFERAL